MNNYGATVPALDDPLVKVFVTKYKLANTPLHVDYVNHGYEQSQCHLSSKHCAFKNGGRRIHGWALWQFNKQIDAEHHSVWETSDGKLVDVTPPKFGGSYILFVRDDSADIVEVGGRFSMFAERTTISGILFVRNGKKTDEPFWGLEKSDAIITGYCSKLGINPDDMLTDTQFG
jgi:hypothetical protein